MKYYKTNWATLPRMGLRPSIWRSPLWCFGLPFRSLRICSWGSSLSWRFYSYRILNVKRQMLVVCASLRGKVCFATALHRSDV